MPRYIIGTVLSFIAAGFLLSATHCKTQKGQSGIENNSCNTSATVVDYLGLDSCNVLLRLSDGRLAAPLQWPVSPDSVLYDGLPVQLSFEKVPDTVSSACEKPDVFIRLNCMEVVVDDSKNRMCMDRIGPTESEWMREVFKRENPWKVTQFQGEDFHYFFFQTPGKGIMYNCYGDSICDVPGRIYNSCVRKLSQLNRDKVIWKKDENE